jgi:hypothetical protein
MHSICTEIFGGIRIWIRIKPMQIWTHCLKMLRWQGLPCLIVRLFYFDVCDTHSGLDDGYVMVFSIHNCIVDNNICRTLLMPRSWWSYRFTDWTPKDGTSNDRTQNDLTRNMTGRRMTERRMTERRMTEHRMTEHWKTLSRKIPNTEWPNAELDQTSKMTWIFTL